MITYTFHLNITCRKTQEVLTLVVDVPGNDWFDAWTNHVIPESVRADCYDYQLLKIEKTINQ